jgi:hypothetical protein
MDQTTTSTPESELKAADFAIQTEHAAKGKLGRMRSLRKRMPLVWNPRAPNLRRVFLRRWIGVR